ncbi:hypothetical protein K469DRAFT_763258, partial [Zopfia rhizophila CBS 207.26]
YGAGWSLRRIASHLEIPYSTVQLCCRQQITPTKPHGRPPILTTPIHQRLVEHATSSHKQCLKPRREVAHKLGINVNKRTLAQAFNKKNYHHRVATKKPLLTPRHI